MFIRYSPSGILIQMPIQFLKVFILFFSLNLFILSRHRRKNFRRPVEPKHRVNERIRVPEVRLVGDNVEPNVYPTRKALQIARDKQLDLVEIAPTAKPPVCRIIDYNKFLYDKKRKEKQIKANSQKTVIKEIRFTPNTDDHDFEFKANHAERFLKEGAKVKAYVQFKGRTILFKERGELLLLKFAQRLEEFGALEQFPKLEGRRMMVFIAPKKAGVKKGGSKKAKKASAKKGGPNKDANKNKEAAKKPVPSTDAVAVNKPAVEPKPQKEGSTAATKPAVQTSKEDANNNKS